MARFSDLASSFVAGFAGGFADVRTKQFIAQHKAVTDATVEIAQDAASKGNIPALQGMQQPLTKLFGPQGFQGLLQMAQGNAEAARLRREAGERMFKSALGTDMTFEQFLEASRGGPSAAPGAPFQVGAGPGGGLGAEITGLRREAQAPAQEPATPPAAVSQITGTETPTTPQPLPARAREPMQVSVGGVATDQRHSDALAKAGRAMLSGGLRPGQSMTIKLSDIDPSFPPVSFNISGTERPEVVGRRLLSFGTRIGASPEAIMRGATEAGATVPDKAFAAYQQAHATSVFNEKRKELAATGLRGRDLQAEAVRETWEATGVAPKGFESLLVVSAEDAQRASETRVMRRLNAGYTLEKSIEFEQNSGNALSPQSIDALATQVYEQTFQRARAAGMAPEQSVLLASAASAGRGVPPQHQQFMLERVVRPESEEALAAGGKRAPTRGELAGRPTATPADIEAARRRIEIEEPEERAGRETAAREEVLRRLPLEAQQDVDKLRNLIKIIRRVRETYKPEYVGPGKMSLGKLGERIGTLSDEENAFRTAVGRLVRGEVFGEAGKTAVGREMDLVNRPLPDIPLASNTFRVRLDELELFTLQALETTRQRAEEQRFRPPQGGGAAPALRGVPAPPDVPPDSTRYAVESSSAFQAIKRANPDASNEAILDAMRSGGWQVRPKGAR